MNSNKQEDSQDNLQYKLVRLTAIQNMATTCCKVIGAIIIAQLIMSGLIEIAGKAPEQIGSLAKVVEAFKFAYWLPWGLSAIFGMGWFMERKGKKRAIAKKNKYKKIIETQNLDRTDCELAEDNIMCGE